MERVLLIDDEPNVLNAFKRRLSSTYDVVIANSATAALEQLRSAPQTAVVISDMYMPGIQGVELLREVSRKYPDTTRVMLTGLNDQKTAARAINEGAVFRFLTKPVSVEELEKVINDSIEHRALMLQERDLLQNTLGGIIRLLNDLLAFIDPEGIALANRQRSILRELGKGLGVQTLELELAALLLGIGRLSLPLELLLKMAQGGSLSPVEAQARDQAPIISARLLKQIPRFEKVSQIIEGAHNALKDGEASLQPTITLFLISQRLASSSGDNNRTVEQKLNDPSFILTSAERTLLAPLLKSGEPQDQQSTEAETAFPILIRELCAGQRLIADVTDKNGKLLLRSGFIISPAVVERVKNHHELVGVREPILVHERIPTRGSTP